MEIKINFKFGGLGFVLSVVFAVLKLIGVIDWSWLIVCSPVIIGFVGTVLLFVGMIIFTTLMMPKGARKYLKESRKELKKKKEY